MLTQQPAPGTSAAELTQITIFVGRERAWRFGKSNSRLVAMMCGCRPAASS